MGGLKIMRMADGTARDTWYARVTRNGQKVNVNLKVRIRGTIPTDGKGRFLVNGRGDEAFRESRARALEELHNLKEKAGKTSALDREKRILRLQTGKTTDDTPLARLPALWRTLPRETPPTEERMTIYDATFRRFMKFAAQYTAKNGGSCESVNTITPEIAAAWFEDLRQSYAWETVKNQMSLLSGAYRRWATNGKPNPFIQIIKRHRGTGKISKKPLTEAEIDRVFVLSQDDAFYHPLIVCAACTGMRIGDVCNLKWTDVDLKGGLIDVVTSKAGIRVTIPIFAALRKVLEARLAVCDKGDIFVFPLAAEKYNHKSAKGKYSERSSLMRGVKPYLATAIFGDKPEPDEAELVGEERPALSTEETVAVIEQSRFAPGKKARVIDTYRRFMSGDSYAQITLDTGRNKGQSTQDLQTVEELTGQRIRPGDRYARKRKTVLTARALIKRTRGERKVGKVSASLYGWHSFRTGFVVLAVENGVPIEDVQKIVGHASVKMTMDYYRPTKKHAAERVRKQMHDTVLEKNAKERPTLDASDMRPPPVRATVRDQRRALALTLAALPPDQAKTAGAVLKAAQVDTEGDPERALALVTATLMEETQKRLAAVYQAAGL